MRFEIVVFLLFLNVVISAGPPVKYRHSFMEADKAAIVRVVDYQVLHPFDFFSEKEVSVYWDLFDPQRLKYSCIYKIEVLYDLSSTTRSDPFITEIQGRSIDQKCTLLAYDTLTTEPFEPAGIFLWLIKEREGKWGNIDNTSDAQVIVLNPNIIDEIENLELFSTARQRFTYVMLVKAMLNQAPIFTEDSFQETAFLAALVGWPDFLAVITYMQTREPHIRKEFLAKLLAASGMCLQQYRNVYHDPHDYIPLDANLDNYKSSITAQLWSLGIIEGKIQTDTGEVFIGLSDLYQLACMEDKRVRDRARFLLLQIHGIAAEQITCPVCDLS